MSDVSAIRSDCVVRWRAPVVVALIAIGISVLPGSPSQATAQEWQPLTFDVSAAPIDNPLKGMVGRAPSTGTFPHGLERVDVLLRDVMLSEMSFDWSSVEATLDAVASRGRQSILRVVVDQPFAADDGPDCADAGEDPWVASGYPAFLVNPVLCGVDCLALSHYCDLDELEEGFAPDVTDANWTDALDELVPEMANRFDGDARVGFVEVGLLGHRGEWHTENLSATDPRLLECEPDVPSDLGDAQNESAVRSSMDSLLDLFDDNFFSSFVLVGGDVLRCDLTEVAVGQTSIGFVDRKFGETTLDPGGFADALIAAGFENDWKFLPIVGDVPVGVDAVVHSSAPQAAEFDAAIAAVHASWTLHSAAVGDSLPLADEARARVSAELLGYTLWLSEAGVMDVAHDETLSLGVRFENAGVAPFYYDWPIELAARAPGDGRPRQIWIPEWFLEDAVPGKSSVRTTVALLPHGLGPGTYTVSLRVPNPLETGSPLRFANAEQGPDWLDLGSIEISQGRPGYVPSPGELFVDGFESGTGVWSEASP